MTLCRVSAGWLLVSAIAGCGDEVRKEPAPTGYAWPQSFAFVMECASETRTDSAVVTHYEVRKIVRFAQRDEQYLVWHDSVIKDRLLPGRAPQIEPYVTEDTMHYYVSLDRRGQVTDAEPGCDPRPEASHGRIRSCSTTRRARAGPGAP
jgi:hypothetical protein